MQRTNTVERLRNIVCLPKQREVFSCGARNIMAPGGLGSGKTWQLCMMALLIGCMNAKPNNWNPPVMCVEPTSGMVLDILIPTFQKLLGDLSISYEMWGGHRAKFRIWIDGQTFFEIHLRSYHNPRRLVGAEYCAVLIDEAGDATHEVFEVAMKRVRIGRHRLFYCGGTPEGHGAFYDYSEAAPLDNTALIRGSTRDNVFLEDGPEAYIKETLAHLSEDDLRQYVRGFFVARGGRVYDLLDETRNFRRCKDPFIGEPVMLCDFGTRTVAWLFGRVYNDVMHIWGEYIGRNTNTLKQVANIKPWLLEEAHGHIGFEPRWEDVAGQFTAITDAAGATETSAASTTDVVILRKAGFEVEYPDANPHVRDRIYAVQGALANGNLLIDPEGAPYLARCLRQQPYDKEGKKPLKAHDSGKGPAPLDHGNDALGYGVHKRFPMQAPAGNSQPHMRH